MSATRQPVWDQDGPRQRQPPPQHDPYTPTREMAQSAAQKASDAYAMMRQFQARVDDLDARIGELAAENAVLHGRIVALEAAPVSKRKAT